MPKILTGMRCMFPDWMGAMRALNDILLICDFDTENLEEVVKTHDIQYILPLSPDDYATAERIDKETIKILYPSADVYALLDNKVAFTRFMMTHYPEMLPSVYYLEEERIGNDPIDFPVIVKPMYSVSGGNMRVCMNAAELDACPRTLVQRYIADEYEYGAFLMCIDGRIEKSWILGFPFQRYHPYHIKCTNFPSMSYVIRNKGLLARFAPIVKHLQYTGGMCINFKWNPDLGKVWIFEINPRLGGSAFELGFLRHLLSF